MNQSTGHSGFQGPWCWLVTTAAGAILGGAAPLLMPATYVDGRPLMPVWLVAPFAVLLLSIATMPFISGRIWHSHFPDFAFFLGSFVAAYYLLGYHRPAEHSHGLSYGAAEMLHAAEEYLAFVAVVLGLYVVSGGVLIEVRRRGTPLVNTLLLGVGAILANLVGTTGASMLLIRPFMRINTGRLRPIHIVLFIFVVSNCGGCLTPIGDPPLYLGFIKGVPFSWTARNLWPNWLLVNGCLLGIFYLIDRRIGPAVNPPQPAELRGGIRVRGIASILSLALILATVIGGPAIVNMTGLHRWPVVAATLVIIAVTAYVLAPRDILAANEFTFFPVKEVGLLFLGIFLTMTPALGYLAANGARMGMTTPTDFYFGTGSLSAVLDNAPTYLNCLQVAVADPSINPMAPGRTVIDPETIRAVLYEAPGVDRLVGVRVLDAVSAAAVFFGAMTYIGNGPNFMVKAIAEQAGVDMPSFFGYLVLASTILLPILVLNWALLIR